MRIGIFGGVFNPPHVGHLMIARQVLDFTDIEEVWFLPNYGQIPPKAGVAEAEHRAAMTKLLKLPKTNVSTLEIDHTLDGDTINLLPYLPKHNTYTFIMGADQLAHFHLWGQWEALLQQMPFLVFPRLGYPNAPLRNNMTMLAHTSLIISDISSTKIRDRKKQGLSIVPFVTPEVDAYIRRHGLYTGQ